MKYYKIDTILDLDDSTKVMERNNFIHKIGKNLKHYNCIDIGVFVGTTALVDAIEKIYNEKGDVSLSEGVQVLADKRKMKILNIKDSYWQDVDSPETLEYAEKILLKNQTQIRN